MKKYDCKKELIEWIKFYNKHKAEEPKTGYGFDSMQEYDKKQVFNKMLDESQQYNILMNKFQKILNKTTRGKDISLGVTTDCTMELYVTVYFDESTAMFEKLVKENKILIIKASLPSGRWSCTYNWDFKNKKVIKDAVTFQSMVQIQDAYDRMSKALK